MSVRVRFAPSPTGPLHMGGVRTALFNYLFARKHQGTMILRIEDTDQGRFVPGAEEYIMESLEWCGIQIDEGIKEGGKFGPYRQSDRKLIYKQYADQLLESGWAYYSFDSSEDLDAIRKEYESRKETFSYDTQTRKSLRNSLTLAPDEVKRLLHSGVHFVVRFRMPENHEIVMQDIIRGEVRVNTATLDDKVLFKSDRMPTYHLANVVDDHLMEISHVIRGEEWLPSLPLHVMLYKAFGWTDTMPQFAHLPLILKPNGNGKLSKRDGDKLGFPVFPINWNNPETNEIYSGYREAGYFREAFVNILALLGWNDGTDKEIYTTDELIQAFSLERVGKSGSRFDPEKAKWFNHQYMLLKSNEEIAEEFIKAQGSRLKAQVKAQGSRRKAQVRLKAQGSRLKAQVKAQGSRLRDQVEEVEWNRIVKIISLVKERAEFVKDIWSQAWFFFEAPTTYDEAVIKKRWSPEMPLILKDITSLLLPYLSLAPCALSLGEFETLIKGHIVANSLNMGNVMNILRLCLVGSSVGPGVFDIMALLGPKEVIARIDRAVQTIG